MNEKELKRIEDIIGYNYNNLDLLQQAFVRRSYSEENGGENNEVLEFIGDKALDIVIVKLLTDRFGFLTSECGDYNPNDDCDEFCCELSEGDLTELKRKLVEKKMLAQCIDRLQLADYLIMSDGDWKNEVYKSASVKEDLFEAIIGAVALDCNWDFSEIANVINVMLNPEQYLEEETVDNYINLTQEWAIKKSGEVPLYHFKKGDYQSTWYIPFDGVSQRLSFLDSALNSSYIKYHCLLKLDDNLPIFRGFGASKSEARKAVCKVAYEYLEKNNLLFSIKDEIKNPNKNEAISQLEILARRDYFSIPDYQFEQTYDENGNPIWSCHCCIEEVDKTFGEQSSSKKEAKKGAAFKMLQYVLKAEEEK